MIAEIFLILLTVYFLSLYWKKKENLPPGPWGFPFIGSVPFGTIEACLETKRKYGDLFMTRTGIANFLYICDYKIAKEAFSKLEFSNRPDWKFLYLFSGERKNKKSQGIIFNNGERWFHSRRFLLRHLRDLGMGKSKIEGIILHEIENLVEEFKSLTNRPTKLPFCINIVTLNIIWQLITSNRYDFSDKKVEACIENVTKIQKVLETLAIPDFFPVLKYIVPKPLLDYLVGQNITDEMCLQFEDIVQPEIDEHVKKLDINNPCDLMDDYLKEMKEKNSDNYSHFSYSDLTRITFDLFTAGNETTASMIRWVLLYVAKFPHVQRKIQEEIDRLVPIGTPPGLEHREGLAYLDATINEVQRHSSLIPFGVFRSTTSDSTLNGYFIPKNTVVLSVAALSHRSPVYWKDPDDFDPSRFMDANGKYIVTCDGFQPFGMGKRQCLGEQFARMELYLILAALFQTFTFEPPEGEEINITPFVANNLHFPRKDQKFVLKLRQLK